MNFQRSAVVDVKAWMARADELVKIVETLVGGNSDILTQRTINPQCNEEAAKGVVELGYRDVRHFCESFPAKFQVSEWGIISLRNSKKPDAEMSYNKAPGNRGKSSPPAKTPIEQMEAKISELRDSIGSAVAWNRPELNSPHNIDPDRNFAFVSAAEALGFKTVRDFCARYPDQFSIHPQTGVITSRCRTPKPNAFAALEGQQIYLDPVTGAWLKNRKPTAMNNDNVLGFEAASPVSTPSEQQKPLKMEEKIHFKLSHGGVTRRFALSRGEEDLLSALKARVLKITGTDVALFWKDEDSLIILDCEEDMNAAIDYAETQNKLACVTLETGATEKKEEKEDNKTDAKVVTAEESMVAFQGYAFMCDACDCYLAPSNGGRFKCTLCDNYDLCAACLAKGQHDNHAFVRLLNAETEVPVSNEIGGVLSMQTRDAPRCTPTFVAKKGDLLKGADKVFIDVINSVGTHVGKKMYDTAEWLKKEAEKMGQRREEAEIEEQKMVEEIIRREREEEEKKWKKRREDRQRQEQMNLEKELAKKESEEANDLRARLAQLEKDRRMAEQMWREEKKHWKGTRRQFRKEEKHLRKAEKVQAKTQKEADKPRKEETKSDEKQEEKKMTTPIAPVLNEYYELSSSSDDSDMEMLDKPTEKNDSIVSDLVILEEQKSQPAAAAADVAAVTKQMSEMLHPQQQMNEEARFAAALSIPAAPQEAQQKQSSIPKETEPQAQQSIYPQLPEPVPERRRPEWGRDARIRGGAYMDRDLDRQADLTRAERERAWRTEHEPTDRQFDSIRNVYDEEARSSGFGRGTGFRRSEGWGRPRGGFGDVGDRELGDRIRESRAARAAERAAAAAAMAQKEKETEIAKSKLYTKARSMPKLMEMAVIVKLENTSPQGMDALLSEHCDLLEKNAYSRQPHARVFSDNERFDNELIQQVAENLLHRLRSMQRIIRNSTPDNRARMVDNRMFELKNDQQPEREDGFDYDAKAAELADILLTLKYTINRSPFGLPPIPFANFGQGLNALMDQSGLGNYLSGFMVPPPHGGSPFTTRPIPRPAPETAASAAPSAPAAAAPAASAPAEEKPQELRSDMTNEQQKVLRQLFESGMFQDYDKMVKVCRKTSDINEAIDMMLQE